MLEVVSKIPERLCCKALTPNGEWEHWCVISTRSRNIMPGTTCLSIGLTDCTGALIYENDIVSFRGQKAVIRYNGDDMRYDMEFLKENPDKSTKRSYVRIYRSQAEEIEIIGNIFDKGEEGNV